MACQSETGFKVAHSKGVSTPESAGMPLSSTEGLAKQRNAGSLRVEAQAERIEAAGVEGRPQDVHDKSKQPSTTFHETGGVSTTAILREKAQKTDGNAKSRCSIC